MNEGGLKVGLWTKLKDFFQVKSGGKTIVAIKKLALPGAALILLLAGAMAWLGPKEDHTYYRQTYTAPKHTDNEDTSDKPAPGLMAGLFGQGKKALEEEKRKQSEQKRRKVAIRYFAPQVLGTNSKGPKAIRSGSKLVGFLVNPIDTRASSPVRVRLPQGGESGGVSIEPGSELVGQFSYGGNGDRLFMSFSRLDPPDGEPRKVSAQALDASDFTAGVVGEVFTGSGVKLASSLGLTMAAGMTDVLTDRESVGNGMSFGAVQAKPTMKNALLQGVSHASQDQAARTASEIQSARDYIIVPQGKEMIIELMEDYRK